MRKGLLGSIAALMAGASFVFAQPPARTLPPISSSSQLMAQGGQPGVEPVPTAPMPALGPGGPIGVMGPDGNPGLPPGSLGNMFGQPADPLGPGPDTECGYTNFETLLWFIRSMPATFPLVSAGTTITQGAQPDLGSTTLFGAQNFQFNPFVGARFTVGKWFRSNPLWGMEWSAFVTEARADRFVIGVGDQVLARPFIDATTGLPASFIIASPGFARGGVNATVLSQLWGMEWNLQRKLWNSPTKNVAFQLGFRYLDLHESLAVQSQSFFDPGVTTFFYGLNLAPFRIDVEDAFDTRNQYFMGQLGLQGEWHYRRWVFGWGGKLGLGDVRETSDITGLSRLVLTQGSAPNEVPGGLLALSSNIGRSHDDKFVVMPEGKVSIGYRMWKNVDLALGYSILYLSRAIRPSDQIDPNLNPAFIPTSNTYSFPAGPARPHLIFNQSDFWVQGLNFSLSIHY